MTVTAKALVPAKFMSDTLSTEYGATSLRAIVDKSTVTNTGSANCAFSAHVVPVGGTPDTSNVFVRARVVVPGETYMCPELVGQYLDPGTSLVFGADLTSTLNLRVSGREIT